MAMGSTATWTSGTTYIYGSEVPGNKQAQIVYHIYCDGVEFSSVVGVSEWEGDLPQGRGETKTYYLIAELDGMFSEKSPETIYYYGFQAPGAPGLIILNMGG
jgi:hypothetical protein